MQFIYVVVFHLVAIIIIYCTAIWLIPIKIGHIKSRVPIVIVSTSICVLISVKISLLRIVEYLGLILLKSVLSRRLELILPLGVCIMGVHLLFHLFGVSYVDFFLFLWLVAEACLFIAEACLFIAEACLFIAEACLILWMVCILMWLAIVDIRGFLMIRLRLFAMVHTSLVAISVFLTYMDLLFPIHRAGIHSQNSD